jgi:hypothetical protein
MHPNEQPTSSNIYDRRTCRRQVEYSYHRSHLISLAATASSHKAPPRVIVGRSHLFS